MHLVSTEIDTMNIFTRSYFKKVDFTSKFFKNAKKYFTHAHKSKISSPTYNNPLPKIFKIFFKIFFKKGETYPQKIFSHFYHITTLSKSDFSVLHPIFCPYYYKFKLFP